MPDAWSKRLSVSRWKYDFLQRLINIETKTCVYKLFRLILGGLFSLRDFIVFDSIIALFDRHTSKVRQNYKCVKIVFIVQHKTFIIGNRVKIERE